MNDTSLSAFGLHQPPFTKEISDSDLWLPPSKETLVAELVESIEARQSVLLVGEAGVGKTCVLRALRQRLPKERFRLTYCHNATLGRRDFYRQLCVALGLSPKATAAAVFYAVTTNVQELVQSRVHPVFLLDEAHLLHPDVLAHLHIVLVGLPELDDRLALGAHKPLLSRLHARLHIGPVSLDDTEQYLRYRLKLAGCDRELFPREATALIHEASAGAHREIDRLAALALREAARKKRKLIEPDLLRDLIDRQSRAA
jgi:general secretion pathway protein A